MRGNEELLMKLIAIVSFIFTGVVILACII